MKMKMMKNEMNRMNLMKNLLMNGRRPSNLKIRMNMTILMNSFWILTWRVKNSRRKICYMILKNILHLIQRFCDLELNTVLILTDVIPNFSGYCYMKVYFLNCFRCSDRKILMKTCYNCHYFWMLPILNLQYGCYYMKVLYSFSDYYNLAGKFCLSSCIQACLLQIPVMMKLTW
jgi:hypothetical protein